MPRASTAAPPPSGRPRGPLFRFLADDHRRLDRILHEAAAAAPIETRLFEEFRGGLLRHIGIEEKLLLPAARRARGGQPLPLAKLLRAEHGALAALLVPAPTPRVVAKILQVLGPHNDLEEGPGGLYDSCDELLAGEAAALIERMRAYPPVPLAPHNDGPLVEKHVAETLAAARRARESA
jgi:hypothetical protein